MSAAPAAPIGRPAQVFAARCSGSERLAAALGLPIALIGVSADPPAEVQRLQAWEHGSLAACAFGGTPFRREPDWQDWSLINFDPLCAGLVPEICGIRIRAGGIRVMLAAGSVPADLGIALGASLRHLRLEEVANRASAVQTRYHAGRALLAEPRYTRRVRHGEAECVRVDDLYAFHPWDGLPSLCTAIEAALMAMAGPRAAQA